MDCATGEQKQLDMSAEEIRQMEAFWEQMAAAPKQKTRIQSLEDEIAELKSKLK